MNTFLIVSDTIYFINKKLEELKNGIENVITFNMDVNTIDEVIEEASYMSMFDWEKCLVVKNAKFFGSSKTDTSKKNKEACEKLLKYLNDENKNTKIIFIYNGKVDSKKKIYNLLKSNNNVFEYPSMSKTEMKNELKALANENGYIIGDDSLWYIINNSCNNFDLAVNELKKLMLYYGSPTKVINEDVVNLTSKSIEENNFKLVDSIISKDLNLSLKYLEEAEILKIEPSIILSLLYREYKLMLNVLIYEEFDTPTNVILKELHLADWQLQKVKNNLRMYKKKEIKNNIVELSKIDYEFKSGLINKNTMLITYIINHCL